MTSEYFYMIIACIIVIGIWLAITSWIIITQELKIGKLERDIIELQGEAR